MVVAKKCSYLLEIELENIKNLLKTRLIVKLYIYKIQLKTII